MQPDIFPDLDTESVLEATRAHWDLTGPYPVPRGQWLACPVCSSPRIQGQSWTRQVRPGATIVHRVDVRVKCTECACCWVHGVAVPDDYGRRNGRRLNEHVPWREVRRINETYPNQQEEPS